MKKPSEKQIAAAKRKALAALDGIQVIGRQISALDKQLTADKTKLHAEYSRACKERHVHYAKLTRALERKRSAAWQERDRTRAQVRRLIAWDMYPPKRGAFVAYKKVYFESGSAIATLEIPAKAKRLDFEGTRKCRASCAKVLKIEPVGVAPKGTRFYSTHDPNFTYKVGRVVKPRGRFQEWDVVCASGIHFFMKRADAEAW